MNLNFSMNMKAKLNGKAEGILSKLHKVKKYAWSLEMLKEYPLSLMQGIQLNLCGNLLLLIGWA